MAKNGATAAIRAVLVLALMLVITLPIASAATPIDQGTFDNLVHYMNCASSAYMDTPQNVWPGSCSVVNSQLILNTYLNAGTNVLYRVSVDTTRLEIVVAFRGTQLSNDQNVLQDIDVIPSDYTGISGCKKVFGVSLCQVHKGFLGDWNSVAGQVKTDVANALVRYPGYQVTVVGHSLGAAIGLFASAEFVSQFGWNVQAYLYAQPLVGFGSWSSAIASLLGSRHHRITRIGDGVNLIPPSPFQPVTSEYFQSAANGVGPGNVLLCSGNKDSSCIFSGVTSIGYSSSTHDYYLNGMMGQSC